ncbi:PREDICTED: uncharacterized protein LOC106101737 [Papilio polytes]|uniref:uncharacterized protein LOC106101737 n=1 Tax=Papilio polytes TaxID=76194 RepID=UPI000676AF45|nr:PREDICTED: uncharacterized protein LOC106101737 [Papilio polytes]XP_013136512.1 PREDICTED: uncharacterized protein LOC106101737 [Papilio polytes]XP_013136513.1 PREDICTED: uncharacterized protein LOC106101737 [Papilio polytes]
MTDEYVHKYYIVRFLEKPYDTVDLEVCVPHGWMKFDKRGQNHSVAYPAEYSLFTKQLVQDNSLARRDWRYYKVKVQFRSDSFMEAENYIKSRNNNEPQITKYSNTEVENKSATKRKTLSSSLGPAAKVCRTKIPHVGNNRTDQKGRSSKQPVPPISMNEPLKKQRKLIEIYKSTTDVEMSTVTNNTVEQTVLEKRATKESFLIQAIQSGQPLTNHNEGNLPTVVNDINYKINAMNEKLECLNTSKAKAEKMKPKRKHNEHQNPGLYTKSSHSQSQQDPSSAKYKIPEEKVTVTSYSKAPNPSSLVPSISHNNPSSKVNRPILCHNQNQENVSVAKSIHACDNVQQSFPKLTVVKTPSALYRLKNKIAQHAQLSSHTHSNRFLTINKTNSSRKPRAQEILDRSSDVNSRDQSAHSESATHQELYIQETLNRSSVDIPIEQSHISQSTTRNGNIPVDVKIPINRTPSCTEEKRQLSEKILNKSAKILFSPNHENHTLEKGSLENLNIEISIKIGDINENSKHLNTSSAVKNKLRSFIHSTYPLNGSCGKERSGVTQDPSIIKPHDQERRTGKPSLNHTEKGIHSKSNTENESCPVLSDLDTKKSFKKQLWLAYQHLIQEQSLSTTEDLDLKVFKGETDEKTSKDHNERTYAQNETKHHHQSDIKSNLFNKNTLDTINMIKRLKTNNVDVSISGIPQKPEENPTNNENKNINVETNYIADGKNIHDNRKNNDRVENDSQNELQTQKGCSKFSSSPLPYLTPVRSTHQIFVIQSKSCSKCSFVLPQEYNPNDSRWTLRYPAIVPGVVELIAGSNIYVNERSLNSCKRVANTYRTLGRLLLVEIFSQNALSVCTLIGRKKNTLNTCELDVRPGLDGEGIRILLKYLEIHGFINGWEPFDLKSVETSLRNRLLEIRWKKTA